MTLRAERLESRSDITRTQSNEDALTPNDSSSLPSSTAASFCLRAEIDGQERTYPLRQGSNILGTSRSCDVVLSAKGVSRRHALLRIEGDSIQIEDLESRNGTYVDGSRVDTAPISPSCPAAKPPPAPSSTNEASKND